MVLARCRLLLKRIYNSFAMFSQDKIAAAQIAQLFGSELLRVQQSAQTDSGSQPSIVTMDPKQFLTESPQYRNAKKAEEQRLIQMLQQEAEASCPLPEQPYSAPVSIPATVPPTTVVPQAQQLPTQINTNNNNPTNVSALDRIAFSLEQIAARLNKVDISVSSKPKRIKRVNK